MAISIFPSTAAEFVSNNFVVDMNDTTNNTADTGGVKQAGPYSMSFSSGDTTFDVYLIDSDGNSVGYSNTTSITASGLFSTVVILGVANDEIISFTYQGSVNNADGEGDQPGAGAYLESISPADLPGIDDTATVTGGNFGTATQFTFESGATVLNAKNASIISPTEALITRPDGLIEDDAPYDLKAVNPGVTPPSSIDFVLTNAVTAGSDPTWVTTSPLNAAPLNSAFSQTLEATDSDGTVVDYSVTAGSIPPGLSLDSSTGVLSGTATSAGNYTFTVTATDDGGNTTARQFEQSVNKATGGTVFDDGGFRYHSFTSTDDFVVLADITDLEYLIVAGGGGGGMNTDVSGDAGSGGGAGGLLSGTQTVSVGTYTATIGAGGSLNAPGSNTQLGSIGTSIGGGEGVQNNQGAGGDGGSGAGGGTSPGTGTAGQGNDGGTGQLGSSNSYAGGGGGASQVGGNGGTFGAGNGGDGTEFATFANVTGLGDSGFFAGGGGGGATNSDPGEASQGGGGRGAGFNLAGDRVNAVSGLANTGGGGGGGADMSGVFGAGASGGSGVVIVRYAF